MNQSIVSSVWNCISKIIIKWHGFVDRLVVNTLLLLLFHIPENLICLNVSTLVIDIAYLYVNQAPQLINNNKINTGIKYKATFVRLTGSFLCGANIRMVCSVIWCFIWYTTMVSDSLYWFINMNVKQYSVLGVKGLFCTSRSNCDM